MKFDKLTVELYQENINWVYSIIKELDEKGIETKDKFLADPYVFSSLVSLGYYFMNLYVVGNIRHYKEYEDKIMTSIIKGASSYNHFKLEQIYKADLDINKLVEMYNEIVRITKTYSNNDGMKARVIAVDYVYRKIYDVFNKRHFNVLIKVFMASFSLYEKRVSSVINNYVESKKEVL